MRNGAMRNMSRLGIWVPHCIDMFRSHLQRAAVLSSGWLSQRVPDARINRLLRERRYAHLGCTVRAFA